MSSAASDVYKRQDLPEGAGEDSISFHHAFGERPDTIPPRPAMIHHGAHGRFAISASPWKLVMESKKRTEKRELYHLGNDPGEKTNVLADHPEVEKRLLAELTRIVLSGATREGANAKNDTPPWDNLVWLKGR